MPLRAQVTLQANGPGNTYELINSALGGSAEEVPDCSDPAFGRHITEEFDGTLNKNVFVFHIHVTPDNDRCINFDRQRNEIKTYGPSPAYVKGFYGDTCAFRWKFKLDAAFQPSPNFTHIHQIKAGDGSDADSPLVTITPRSASPERLEIIYTAPTGLSGSGTKATATLSNFKGQWIEAFERVLYTTNGFYQLTLRRVSDGVTLLSYTNNNLNLWRGDATFNRPKWGIYRSLNSSNYLRDEMVRFADFCISKGTDICPSDVGAPPPFTISAGPATQTVTLGGNTSYTVSLVTNIGFTGPVWLTALGIPLNASAGFTPPSLNNSGSSTLAITTATNTPVGIYNLTVTATNSTRSTNVSISLVVAAASSNLVWNSSSSAAWDTTTANWFNELSGTNDFFQNGKNVIFTDRPGVVTNITLAFGAAVAPAFMTVNAQLNNYNISGAGKITGTNSLLKTGAGKLTLSTSNDYTGPTIVSNGTLIVNGSLANTPVTVMNGASLGGNGTLGGDLTINPGGTLSPGTSLGTLTVAGPVLLAGAISMELNQGLGTNDVLQSAATIQYGGVLSLTNISGALTVADSFKLFSAPAYSGSFAKLTPAIPALNLAWDTNTLATDGTLRILSVPTPQPQITQFGIRAGNLILAGANGVAGWPYCLLATTNLALPLSAWTCLATNQFDDTGSFAITAPANPSLPRQFFLLRLLAL